MLFCTTGGRLLAALARLTVPCGDPGDGGGRGGDPDDPHNASLGFSGTPWILPDGALLPAFFPSPFRPQASAFCTPTHP